MRPVDWEARVKTSVAFFVAVTKKEPVEGKVAAGVGAEAAPEAAGMGPAVAGER